MEKTKKETKYLLALAKNPHLNTVGIAKILGVNISLSEIFNSKASRLEQLELDKKLREYLIETVKNISVEEAVEELEKLKINYITLWDEDYPVLLKEIHTPPVILYYKGVLPKDISIGIVGSRKPTDYGRAITRDLSFDLASAGIIVTSGLALGIDSIAHEAALAAKGKTVAVLGCGLDQVYPTTHEKLAARVIENGALVSEYPPGMPPLRQNFPARNRIISGLSVGLLVTEAAEGSGSLITARDALEQNREVFAVPGAVYNSNSFGPNSLIKMGAKLVTGANDIFEELGLANEIVKSEEVPKSPDEALVYEILNKEPLHIDSIIKESGKTHSEISSVLTLMEISGKIKHLGGLVYRINR